MPELRVRVKLYKNELGDSEGLWTYFLRIGEDNPGMTFHAETAWEKKEDALISAKQKATDVMEAVKKVEPSALWRVDAWHEEGGAGK